jgi:hypothetical protein
VYHMKLMFWLRKTMSWQWLNVNFILQENKSNVKVPLYVFRDLMIWKKEIVFSKNEIISKCWIVTNNRFTSDAIDFKCSGMNCWDYPKDNNLKTKTILIVFILSLVWPHCLWQKKKIINIGCDFSARVNNSEQLGRIGLSANRIKMF